MHVTVKGWEDLTVLQVQHFRHLGLYLTNRNNADEDALVTVWKDVKL